MAKKKRRVPKEEEESYEFVPPEFDEKEFLLKDIQVTKIVWVVTALAAVMGIVAYFFSEMFGEMVVGILILAVSLLGLRQVLSLIRLPVDEVDNKGMMGNYMLFLLLFLGVWVMCMNPPINDHTNPIISDMTVYYDSGSGFEAADTTTTGFFFDGTGTVEINISAMVADNNALDSVVITWDISGDNTEHNMTLTDDNTYEFRANVTAPSSQEYTQYQFRIVATDAGGNTVDSGNYAIRVYAAS